MASRELIVANLHAVVEVAVLNPGIAARRRYRFLGFTESQVKAGKLMFFREDARWTVESLLSSFGNLPSVYEKSGYGKYSARLGLSFSSTAESFDVLLLL